MPIDFTVVPLSGIGPVRLDMTRAESRTAMGRTPDSDEERDAYFGGSFQVFFDERGLVEYIELSPSPEFAALYKGVNVHASKAVDIVALISKDAPYDAEDPEFGYSYLFPALELSVWRPVQPESDTDPDGQCFSTVGVGRKGYYSS